MTKTHLLNTPWVQILQDERGIITVTFLDGVLVVPVTAQNEVILITEPSPSYDYERCLTLVAGAFDVENEPPHVTANRELQEEIGLQAARLDLLAVLRPEEKYIHCDAHIYLARDLSPSLLPKEPQIELVYYPLARFEELIHNGRLQGSTPIAALFLARQFIQQHGD